MSAAELLALAERVERAEGPDRELDGLIADELSEWENLGGWRQRHKVTGVVERFTYQPPPSYTGSLDAAMSLVPEGDRRSSRWWVLDSKGRASIFYERGDLSGEQYTVRASAATPALALTAASLRARAAMEVDRG